MSSEHLKHRSSCQQLRRLPLITGLLCVLNACSADDAPPPSGVAGSGGASTNNTTAAVTTSPNTQTSLGGSSSSASSGGGSAGSAGVGGAGGDAGFSELGVCGKRGRSTVNLTDTFEGYEEFYIIGEEGFGTDICVVRFDVTRVGAAPEGCAEFAGQQDECLWTHSIEYQNPSVELDENGVCANSELGLDAEAIADIEGSQVAYGFVSEYQGHNSVLMQYNPLSDQWGPAGNATWDEETAAFRFDDRDGLCGY